MDMYIRAAEPNDLEEIMRLIGGAVEEMERTDIHQWDEVYPTKEDMRVDITRGCSYVGIIDGSIAVVYAVNKDCDEQYKNGAWDYDGDGYIVIHRLCVSPEHQHQGIAKETLKHIEDETRRRGTKAVRLDVFCENPYALRLYSGNGYREVGRAHWRKGEFLLMEKLL